MEVYEFINKYAKIKKYDKINGGYAKLMVSIKFPFVIKKFSYVDSKLNMETLSYDESKGKLFTFKNKCNLLSVNGEVVPDDVVEMIKGLAIRDLIKEVEKVISASVVDEIDYNDDGDEIGKYRYFINKSRTIELLPKVVELYPEVYKI